MHGHLSEDLTKASLQEPSKEILSLQCIILALCSACLEGWVVNHTGSVQCIPGRMAVHHTGCVQYMPGGMNSVPHWLSAMRAWREKYQWVSSWCTLSFICAWHVNIYYLGSDMKTPACILGGQWGVEKAFPRPFTANGEWTRQAPTIHCSSGWLQQVSSSSVLYAKTQPVISLRCTSSPCLTFPIIIRE